MALPLALRGKLRLPVVAAPMFLTSGPDLVVECCRAGILGSFPALNQRTTEGFVAWMQEITARIGDAPDAAPWGVREQLMHEKTALGFYLSGHLFDADAAEVRQFVRRELADLSETAGVNSLEDLAAAEKLLDAGY